MANGKLRVLRAITQHSLGNSPEVGSVPSSAEGLEPRAPRVCDLGHLGGRVCDLGHLCGQSNRRHRFSHSAAPQHLADRSLIRILGNVRERKQKPVGGSPGLAPGGGVDDLSAAAPARPWETSITHGCWGDSQSHLLAKRGHLSWGDSQSHLLAKTPGSRPAVPCASVGILM